MSNKINTATLDETVNLQTAFMQTRQQSLDLIANLSAEDCQAQSIPDASPAKWHLAHTTWFFETMVLQYFENDFAPWRKEFTVLFNSYYNAVGDKHPRPARGLLTRPTLDEVITWRQQVDVRMQKLLTDVITTELAWITELGIHHEQQHQELLLTDIHHLFATNSLLPSYLPEQIPPSESAGLHQWLIGPQQEHNLFKLGFNASATGFHFDNEAPQHTVYLAPYSLDSQLVTNRQWLEFIQAGGYQEHQWWLDAGWAWINQEKIQAPLYWSPINLAQGIAAEYAEFTLRGNVPLNLAAPVSHISYFEAEAFARWLSATHPEYRGARLPTEFEWEAFALNQAGNAIPESSHLLDTHNLVPMPSACDTLYGDVWQWTSSNYGPYPGFQPWDGVAGEYNGKFMVNQMVLKGGSCLTPRSHIRPSYRNFFPAHTRWQMTGLRLARDAS